MNNSLIETFDGAQHLHVTSGGGHKINDYTGTRIVVSNGWGNTDGS